MMQGDSYGLPIELRKDDGSLLTAEAVQEVEVTIGYLQKSLKDGSVTYESDCWIAELSQEETFKLPATYIPIQVRVMWKSGDVEGLDLGMHKIDESLSRRVLK